jgi:predicted DNA-binding protein with PD1-like motif
VLDAGDEAVASLTARAKEHGLSNAQITAVGAFRAAVVGRLVRDFGNPIRTGKGVVVSDGIS